MTWFWSIVFYEKYFDYTKNSLEYVFNEWKLIILRKEIQIYCIGLLSVFSNSSVVVFKIWAKTFSSISVTNLLPHSIRWIAFLSKSIPFNCNFSANALWETLGRNCFLRRYIFSPHKLFFPLKFYFYTWDYLHLDNINHNEMTFSDCQYFKLMLKYIKNDTY